MPFPLLYHRGRPSRAGRRRGVWSSRRRRAPSGAAPERRLVAQENARGAHERPGDREHLLLASGQRPRELGCSAADQPSSKRAPGWTKEPRRARARLLHLILAASSPRIVGTPPAAVADTHRSGFFLRRRGRDRGAATRRQASHRHAQQDHLAPCHGRDGASEPVDELLHPPPRRRVRQLPLGGAEIVEQVLDLRHPRHAAGDRRVRHDVLRKNCAQLAQSTLPAHGGSSRPCTAWNSRPRPKGRLIITAMPRSAASGRMVAAAARLSSA